MSEAEFWGSTLYKINKLCDFYLKEHGGSVEDSSKVVATDEVVNKWGRPIVYSHDF